MQSLLLFVFVFIFYIFFSFQVCVLELSFTLQNSQRNILNLSPMKVIADKEKKVVTVEKFQWALTLTLTLTRHSHHSQRNKVTLLQHKGREGGKGRGENLLYCISLLHSCLQLTNAQLYIQPPSILITFTIFITQHHKVSHAFTS